MTKLIDWVKTHKAVTFLLFVLAFFVLGAISPKHRVFVNKGSMSAPMSDTFGTMEAAPDMAGSTASIGKMMPLMPSRQAVPPSDSSVRMISKDTSLSLKVDDVAATVERVEQTTTTLGGYLIDSNVSAPEGASSGSINVRVPSEKRTEALAAFKALGVKTVSEYVMGQDVTDQFVDNEERLRILEATKVKFEAILAEAKNVNEMLNVQQQLLSLQQQIDSIKGQQKYLEGSAKYSRISVYLATDELALPYAPVQSWRPQVVLKEAVRSLMLHIRGVGTVLIWALVYAPAIIILALIAWMMYRKTRVQ
jgi:hypothetical protein